nr:hypothetical protein [Bacteroidales bacterium]
MNQNKFAKIFALVVFVAFMLISCWATVESLHLLLPSWPIPVFWVATLGIFFLASMGSKMIIDSFNQRLLIDHRGAHLIGGIIMLLVFWVAFSLPTNTHTFFYRSVVMEVLSQDLMNTKNQLESLDDDNVASAIVMRDAQDYTTKVENLWKLLKQEIMDPGNPGWGPKAERKAIELEAVLKANIGRPTFRTTTLAGRREVVNALEPVVESLKESMIEKEYFIRLINIGMHKNKEDIKKNIYAINKIQSKINENPNAAHEEPTEGTFLVLTNSYRIISNYTDAVANEFATSNPDEVKTLQESVQGYKGNVTRTARLRSVVDVWKDFFAGVWAGQGFLFWIMLAALVDIAGFFFYYIAFNKKEY